MIALSRRAVSCVKFGVRFKSQLTVDSLSPKVNTAQYAVRGQLVLRAMQHEEALKRGEKRPFDKIYYCNIGNPQQLGQKPVSFFRQVLALLDYPDLITGPGAAAFPADVVARAKLINSLVPGGTGAYSESKGLSIVRNDVAEFISKRDGVKANPDDIFLTDGASHGVTVCLEVIVRTGTDGILIPIPQYPLYSATIDLLGGRYVGYYLNEAKGWSLDITELKRAIKEAREQGTTVRALAVINPGNPTGQTLSVENMKAVIKFCEEETLVLMADEVYQANVYGSKQQFTSFRKVVTEMNSKVELMSFHSVSKGVIGECGRRGGFFELYNVDPAVSEQIYKLISIGLCSNIAGQIMVDCMVKPPSPGEPSYELYNKEVTSLYQSLERRSVKLSSALNKMKNVVCTEIQGALYAFPRIYLPEKAVMAAYEKNMEPDFLYCLEMLDATGICVVPGSGFKQEKGTWHFRTTFLPPEEEMDIVIKKLAEFNDAFMKKYE